MTVEVIGNVVKLKEIANANDKFIEALFKLIGRGDKIMTDLGSQTLMSLIENSYISSTSCIKMSSNISSKNALVRQKVIDCFTILFHNHNKYGVCNS